MEDDPNGEDQTIVVTIVRLTEEEIVFEGENEDGEIERVTWNRLK